MNRNVNRNLNRPDPSQNADDEALRLALRELPPSLAGAEADVLGALSARVLAQWAERHGNPNTHAQPGGAVLAMPRPWRRRLWVGTAGLAAAAVVATAVLVTRPDPALEELMQPDVLSQMAIGEM